MHIGREDARGGADGAHAPPKFQILLIDFCRKKIFQKSYKVVHHHSQNANALPDIMHMGPPRESSVRNLLENVGNLRDIAVLVQLNLAFLTFIDLHLHSQIVSDYHPLF